jgi:hypothetical protein
MNTFMIKLRKLNRMLAPKTVFFILVMGCLHIAAQPSVQWSQQISGKGHQWISDVVADASGNIYVAGDFQDTCIFYQYPEAVKLIPKGGDGLFVAKYTAQGKLMWIKQLGGEGDIEAGKLVLDPFGNIYFSGSFTPTLFVVDDPGVATIICREGKNNTYICKLTGEGKVLWLKHFQSEYHNDPGDMAIDTKGNLVCMGRFETMVDLDPGEGVKICKISRYERSYEWPNASGFEVFVVKLDCSGNLLWSHHLAATGDCFGYGVEVDANDQVYCTGTYDGNLFIYDQPHISALPSNSSNSSFVLKMDAMGKIRWNRSLATADVDLWADDMLIDADGNIYLQGIFRNDATFSSKMYKGYINSNGDLDFFLCCLNKYGEVMWVKQFGGEESDHCNDFCLDDQSNIYLSGHFYKSVDFDPGVNQHIETAKNGENLFVLKLDKRGDFQWVYTAGGQGKGQVWSYALSWNKISGLCMSGYFGTSKLELGGNNILVNGGSYDTFIATINDSLVPNNSGR